MRYTGAARNTYRSRCGNEVLIPSASNASFTAFVKSHFTSQSSLLISHGHTTKSTMLSPRQATAIVPVGVPTLFGVPADALAHGVAAIGPDAKRRIWTKTLRSERAVRAEQPLVAEQPRVSHQGYVGAVGVVTITARTHRRRMPRRTAFRPWTPPESTTRESARRGHRETLRSNAMPRCGRSRS